MEKKKGYRVQWRAAANKTTTTRRARDYNVPVYEGGGGNNLADENRFLLVYYASDTFLIGTLRHLCTTYSIDGCWFSVLPRCACVYIVGTYIDCCVGV